MQTVSPVALERQIHMEKEMKQVIKDIIISINDD